MTAIRLHNTLTRQKETLVPLEPDHVRMYVCGPTVYDFAHLGNARPIVVFDTLNRLLRRHYAKVTYVRNITDVDDKIMAKAAETGKSIEEITDFTTAAFHADMAALNARRPDSEPRCTAHIPQMIAMIETLIAKGNAYAAEGHVLFSVPSMPDYGALSRRSRDELVAGARVEVAPYKKDAADFILWKPSTPAQVGWDSPWGRGRPGWHIECSAMAAAHLGPTFDIHGGGLDLIFPHHENEIAQSRCAHDGAPLATIWLHNGFLSINGDKMSKSGGNFFTVRDLLADYPGEVIRLALLSGHYRQPIEFSRELLSQTKTALDGWYRILLHSDLPVGDPTAFEKTPDYFDETLADDINTPLYISHLHDLAKQFHRQPANSAGLQRILWNAGQAIGLLQCEPSLWFKGKPAKADGPTDGDIENQIAARLAARQAKNFKEADTIRDLLAAHGVMLEDGPGGTTWRRE